MNGIPGFTAGASVYTGTSQHYRTNIGSFNLAKSLGAVLPAAPPDKTGTRCHASSNFPGHSASVSSGLYECDASGRCSCCAGSVENQTRICIGCSGGRCGDDWTFPVPEKTIVDWLHLFRGPWLLA